jgi:rhomboid protease GluP
VESLVLTLIITASCVAAFFSLRTGGIRLRVPIATISVAWVTLCVSVVAESGGWVLDLLQRDPAALGAAQWWRIATPLFVQDGGWLGVISNTISLLVLGTLAESFLRRRVWLIGYFVSGLLGEIVAYTLLPQGSAGNSIAILGLAGVVAVVALFRGGMVTRVAAIVSAALGFGMLVLANLHGAGYCAGAVIGLILAPVAAATERSTA